MKTLRRRQADTAVSARYTATFPSSLFIVVSASCVFLVPKAFPGLPFRAAPLASGFRYLDDYRSIPLHLFSAPFRRENLYGEKRLGSAKLAKTMERSQIEKISRALADNTVSGFRSHFCLQAHELRGNRFDAGRNASDRFASSQDSERSRTDCLRP